MRLCATAVGCLVQLCLTPRRKQTVNSTVGTNLGVELLQEGLLSSWHHCVQVRLEGLKLLCQKHTVVVVVVVVAWGGGGGGEGQKNKHGVSVIHRKNQLH